MRNSNCRIGKSVREKSFWEKADDFEQTIRELGSVVLWASVVGFFYFFLFSIVIEELFW